MVLGDIYDIASRVKEYDPSYRLRYRGDGKYAVIVKRRRKFREGTLDGCPLYSLRDYEEQIFEWEGTPDMRIIHRLWETDVWRIGPKQFLDNLERESEKRKQKRIEEANDRIEYTARERHKYIVREFQGLDTKTVF
jgi:hypothetical protein